MNNFFLLNEAIDVGDFDAFKIGMSELVALEKAADDLLMKHKSVYNLAIMNDLYSNFGYDEQIISTFIEQLSPTPNYIDDEVIFDAIYPNDTNGFLGIDFTGIPIPLDRQITNENDSIGFKNLFIRKVLANGNQGKIRSILNFIFPHYVFEPRAIDEITYWNLENFELYERLLELLSDIQLHPFTGGLGKTEVLKNQSGIASKRLTHEDRVTYSLKNNEIKILACKGHYT